MQKNTQTLKVHTHTNSRCHTREIIFATMNLIFVVVVTFTSHFLSLSFSLYRYSSGWFLFGSIRFSSAFNKTYAIFPLYTVIFISRLHQKCSTTNRKQMCTACRNDKRLLSHTYIARWKCTYLAMVLRMRKKIGSMTTRSDSKSAN